MSHFPRRSGLAGHDDIAVFPFTSHQKRMVVVFPRAIGRTTKVAAFIILAVVLAYALLIASLEVANMLRTRTVHERQFKSGVEEWQHDLNDIRAFELRHGLRPEANGGFRLAMDEWPDWKYLISVELQKDSTARGAILAQAYDGKGASYEREFELETTETTIFLETLDHQIEAFWGNRGSCLDGTSFQFERWAKAGLSSGAGNAACQEHYAEIMSVVAEALAFHLNDAPFDWRSWFQSKRILALK